jgi:hypothetical protein
MDILAHTLWANYGSRVGNRFIKNKNKKSSKQIPKINVAWASFFGVFPDFFAFTAPFILGMYSIISGKVSFSSFGAHHMQVDGFDLARFLYQYSHSLVIWAVVFIIVWFFAKRPRFELFGWLLHILIDIPSHLPTFYPTPFLFPISEYRFPYGIQWSNKWYMIINYSLLLIVSIYMMVKFKKIKSSKNNL